MKCRTCARRLDIEKLDYTVGCKHEQMEGFVCLACAFEGVAYWMTNISEDDYCEEYVEKQVTGKLINVETPTKRESAEAEKQVKGDLISRQAVMDATKTVMKDVLDSLPTRLEDGEEVYDVRTSELDFILNINKALQNAIKALPSETHDLRTETHGVCSYDLISRNAALALVVKAIHGTDSEEIKDYLFGGLRKQLWALPSALEKGCDSCRFDNRYGEESKRR